MILLAFLVLLMPGLAVWSWVGKWDQDPLISIAEVIGAGLSIIILIAELFFVLNASFSVIALVILLGVCIILTLFGFLKKGIKFPRNYRYHFFIGIILFGLLISWRFYQARDLLLPNWVDSQHHYLIIRTILENSGLSETLSPYIEGPFYYHYGFHAVAALFSVISKLEIGDTMLVLGQVINAAISLSVYALGKALWRDWRPAVASALLVSFTTRMPAYYLSWGRYTLLTAMILLPLAMGMAIRMLRERDRSLRDVLLLALLTSGVLLSHYFSAALLAIFYMILAVVYLVPRLGEFRTALGRLLPIKLGAIMGLALAAPWLWRVITFYPILTILQSNLPGSLSAVINNVGDGNYIWQLLGPSNNHWLLLAAGIGLVFGIIKRKRISFLLWSLLNGLMSVPWAFTISPFRPDHFVIVSFIPVALWAGYAFWQMGSILGRWLNRPWVSIVLIVLFVGGWIAWSYPLSSDIINPVTVLVTENDLAALKWIKENTPEDAKFYINTAHWQYGIYRGVDGGGWILPYTGRWALVPTVFYGFSEEKEQNQQLRDWGEAASEITSCSSGFWEIVEEAKLNWLYIREGVGSLQQEGLVGCEGVEKVFENNSVGIWKVGY